jgi:maleate isomerase
MGSFNHPDDNEVARISEPSIEDALVELGSHDEVDGVFISCTSLRVCGIVERVEQRLGKPVTSSNHALAWHALRLAGVDEPLDGLGRLFRTPLPA